MLKLIKPQKLQKGDRVATVSLSWGGAGDEEILWRYQQGKERLQEVFGLEVVEMPHTLKGSEYVYNHPEERAKDLMDAFRDESIKGIISCIGGNESIRLLPYIDFEVIGNNPKIYTGYSDSTITHLMCLKAGISSYYGLSVLNDFAENIKMSDYTIEWAKKVLFETDVIGLIPTSKVWTSERLEWLVENKDTARNFSVNNGYELLQGKDKATGPLIGGCLEVLEITKGTKLFPELDSFDHAILFLETSEVMPPDWVVEDNLRNYGIQGVLNKINGIIIGKPQGNALYEEYKPLIKKVLAEFGRQDMPVLLNASFGHNEPKCLIPYGALAEIDCNKLSFSILESGVSN